MDIRNDWQAAKIVFQHPNREESTMSEAPQKKIVKQVCRCEKCGNEAEMVVTCSLESADAHTEDQSSAAPASEPHAAEHRKVKGHGVCSHCGNEADIWVDI
jgi:DNA-directed RNA polymerase subunit M/transcription elongation factor TFIIS